MLKPAQLYTDLLRRKFWEIAYEDKYKFFNTGYIDEYRSVDNNWNTTEFVSIDNNGDIVGYVKYDIDRCSNRVYNFTAINFSKNKIVFGLDLGRVIQDIFLKYKYRKLSFGVFVGNPIESSYDKAIERWNGRIVGIKYQDSRLMDGNYYDYKMYEISLESYLKAKDGQKCKRKE